MTEDVDFIPRGTLAYDAVRLSLTARLVIDATGRRIGELARSLRRFGAAAEEGR